MPQAIATALRWVGHYNNSLRTELRCCGSRLQCWAKGGGLLTSGRGVISPPQSSSLESLDVLQVEHDLPAALAKKTKGPCAIGVGAKECIRTWQGAAGVSRSHPFQREPWVAHQLLIAQASAHCNHVLKEKANFSGEWMRRELAMTLYIVYGCRPRISWAPHAQGARTHNARACRATRSGALRA